MKYTIKKLEHSNVEIEITLNKEEWEKELDCSYQRNKGKYKVEGFRQGHAPRKMIEKLYGGSVFFEDALTESFYNNYESILKKEKDLEPVDAPSLSLKSLDDKNVVIVAQVPGRPEVQLEKYKGLNIKKEVDNNSASFFYIYTSKKNLIHIEFHSEYFYSVNLYLQKHNVQYTSILY